MTTMEKLIEQRTTLCTKKRINKCREVRFYNEQGTRCFWAYKSIGMQQWNVRYGKVVISQQSNGKYELTMSRATEYKQSANGTPIPRTLQSRTQVMELAESIGNLVIN